MKKGGKKLKRRANVLVREVIRKRREEKNILRIKKRKKRFCLCNETRIKRNKKKKKTLFEIGRKIGLSVKSKLRVEKKHKKTETEK